MSRKRFVIWGLGLLHALMLSIFVSAFWDFAKHPDITNKPEIFLRVSFLSFTVGFLFLCWRQIKATGRKPILFFWLILFIIASLPISAIFTIIYTDAVVYGDLFMTMIKSGTLLDAPNKTLFIAASIPSIYLMFLGYFAALFFLARDPKAPTNSNGLSRFKRAPKQTPLQADPLLVNGAWRAAR